MTNLNSDVFLATSIEWNDYVWSQIDGSSSDSEDRLAMALLHLSMEHYGSILQLMKTGHVGSGLALLRPQFEALVRGRWYHVCASAEQKEKFMKGGEPPSVYKMIEQIEKVSGCNDSGLIGLKESIWTEMHSFTHGGIEQASWRITENEITSDFSDDIKMRLLHIANALGLTAIGYVCAITDSNEAAINIANQFKSLLDIEPR